MAPQNGGVVGKGFGSRMQNNLPTPATLGGVFLSVGAMFW